MYDLPIILSNGVLIDCSLTTNSKKQVISDHQSVFFLKTIFLREITGSSHSVLSRVKHEALFTIINISTCNKNG